MNRRGVTLWAIVAAATLVGVVSAAAQGVEGEWSGEIAYDDDTVPFEFVESTIVVSSLDDAGNYEMTAFLNYLTLPICGEFNWTKTFTGTGTLSGESIRFIGTRTVMNTSTCPDPNLQNATFETAVDATLTGDGMEGFIFNGTFSIAGSPLLGPGSGSGSAGDNGEATEGGADGDESQGGADTPDAAAEDAEADAGDSDEASGDETGEEALEGEEDDDGDEEETDEEAAAEDQGEGSDDDGGLDPLVLVGGIGVVGSVGALELRRRRRKGSQPDGEQARPAEEEEEREPSTVSLELTYPAGHSPFVFQFGWVFGARCVVDGPSGQRDLSDQVRWSGSDGAEFHPPVGRISHPSFKRRGTEMVRGNKAHGTITLAVDVDGEMSEKTFTVAIISNHGFAAVGHLARCLSDSHGCPACSHHTIGPITTGSQTVTIGGLPAARVGDIGTHAVCCGANSFTIAGGDPSVLIDGRPAAMVGSRTDHCGGIGSIENAYAG